MIDFTIDAYRRYVSAAIDAYPATIRFKDFFRYSYPPHSFCIIRHDVDRFPGHALRMAMLEQSLGVRSTYYFRVKRHTFNPRIIRSIHRLGHEIGYHYESLSDAGGNIPNAIADFLENLYRLRRVSPVSTVSMHGRPMSPFDNRELLQNAVCRRWIKNTFNLLGEVYLDIDYSDILYLNDTGRNWEREQFNRRDHVVSDRSIGFSNGRELLKYLQNQPHPKLVFQVHPERWSSNPLEYGFQWLADGAVNIVKGFL